MINKITAKQREELFRKELDELLIKHGAIMTGCKGSSRSIEMKERVNTSKYEEYCYFDL